MQYRLSYIQLIASIIHEEALLRVNLRPCVWSCCCCSSSSRRRNSSSSSSRRNSSKEDSNCSSRNNSGETPAVKGRGFYRGKRLGNSQPPGLG